jgi:hypothetical protein
MPWECSPTVIGSVSTVSKSPKFLAQLKQSRVSIPYKRSRLVISCCEFWKAPMIGQGMSESRHCFGKAPHCMGFDGIAAEKLALSF